MAISAISAPRLPGFANNLSSCSTGGGHGQFLSCENQLWDTRHRAVRRTTIGVSVPIPIGQRPWRQYFPRICTSSTWILPVFCRILQFFPWILMIANCHSGKYAHGHTAHRRETIHSQPFFDILERTSTLYLTSGSTALSALNKI